MLEARVNNMHIVIEGLPGSGKTTLATSLTEGGYYIKIDEMLQPINEDADEFAYVEHDIAKCALRKKYRNTVMDRSYLSTLAYNFANDKYSGSKNYPRIKRRISNELRHRRLTEPDLIIYLVSTNETSLLRQKPENAAFWRINEMLGYSQEYVLKYLKRNYGGSVVYIDSSQSQEDVYKQAKDIISKNVKKVAYEY